MAVSKDYGPGFLHADDLIRNDRYTQVKVKIATVHEPNSIKAANGRMIPNVVLAFEGKDKRLVLCSKTNWYCVAWSCGSTDPANWIGKEITLHPVVLSEAFGEPNVPAIRVRVPDHAAIPKKYRPHFGRDITGEHFGLQSQQKGDGQ
jgi:hypothetical protein